MNRSMGSEASTGEDEALQRLRSMCLSLPEASESAAWNHPNFRAGKRTFVAYEWIKGRPSIAFKLAAEDVDLLLLRGEAYFATPYGRGRWISIWADVELDWALIEELIERSYRSVALKRMITALNDSQKT